MVRKFDFLVIGSGIAGMSFALKVAHKGTVALICKATRELCELRNMINVGYLITRQAMERKESRGLHYTIDYPHPQK